MLWIQHEDCGRQRNVTSILGSFLLLISFLSSFLFLHRFCCCLFCSLCRRGCRPCLSGLSCGHQDNRTTAEQHQQVVKHSASHLFSSSRFLHRFCCTYSLLPLARLDTLFVRSAFCSLAIQVALACPTCSCSCSFESSLRPLPCPPCIFCALKGTINYQSVGDQHCWSLRAVVKPRHRPPERLSGSGSRGCRCRR